MSLHLRARVGPYGLLIPAVSVLEVGVGADAPSAWRGRRLPYVDAHALLGLGSAAGGSFVIYGRTEQDAVVLGLGAMAGAVPVAPEAVRPFPPSMPQAYRLFDGVVTLAEGMMLRLRDGLDLAALADPPVEATRFPT